MMTSVSKFPGVALITGAGGTGIGAAIAKAFASSGCQRIAITDINSQTLTQTREAITSLNPQATVHSQHGDVSDPSFVESFVQGVSAKFSRIDYSIHSAGVLGTAKRSHETSVGEFDRINNINYRGTWLTSRAAIGQMLKQEALKGYEKQRGAIVNIASQLGIVARSGAAPYCASKSAIINLTRSDAIDYSCDDIRINCVCPGVISTPMTASRPEEMERFRPAIDIAPMKRMGKPEEVADAVLFLCSAQASFIQGHALVVDGGYTIN